MNGMSLGLRHTDSEDPLTDLYRSALRWRSLSSLFLGATAATLVVWAPSLALRSDARLALLYAFSSAVSGTLSWWAGNRARVLEKGVGTGTRPIDGWLSGDNRRPAGFGAESDEIAVLYQDVRRLQEQESNRPELIAERERKMARLRELQKAQAAAMRKRLESSFSVPLGARLRALRDRTKRI